jgi:hypothetical protein
MQNEVTVHLQHFQEAVCPLPLAISHTQVFAALQRQDLRRDHRQDQYLLLRPPHQYPPPESVYLPGAWGPPNRQSSQALQPHERAIPGKLALL